MLIAILVQILSLKMNLILILSGTQQIKKRPAQRTIEFGEDTQLLCNNLLVNKDDSFVLNLWIFGETNLLTGVPIITIGA